MMNERFSGEDFWKNYMFNWFGKDLIEKWEKYVERKQIDSVNGKINLEIYRNADPKKPTIVFSHGIAGYARLLLLSIFLCLRKGTMLLHPILKDMAITR